MFTKIVSNSSFSSSKNLRKGGGIVERTLTVKHDSYSLPEGRSVKLNFFAPTIYASLTSRKHSFKVK